MDGEVKAVSWGRQLPPSDSNDKSEGKFKRYSSFWLQENEFRPRDAVYLNAKEGPPFIAMILSLHEDVETREKCMRVRWFLRPRELPEGLEGVDYHDDNKEIFLQWGLASNNDVDPGSTMRKCNLVCTAQESWNRAPPTRQQIAASDHVFRRLYDATTREFKSLKVAIERFGEYYVPSIGRRNFASNKKLAEGEKNAHALGKKRAEGPSSLGSARPPQQPVVERDAAIKNQVKGKCIIPRKRPLVIAFGVSRKDTTPGMPPQAETSAAAGGQLQELESIVEGGWEPPAVTCEEPPKKRFFNIKLSWQEILKRASEQSNALLLQNLDPWFSSSEVEGILQELLGAACEARMLPPRNICCYNAGEALVAFQSQGQAAKVLTAFENNVVIFTDETRPVVATLFDKEDHEVSRMHGHFDADQFKVKTARTIEQKGEIVISHAAQGNTVEYEMGLQWRLHQRRCSTMWNIVEQSYKDRISEVLVKDQSSAPSLPRE